MKCFPASHSAVSVLTPPAENFYDILNVNQSASDRDIKSAYRKLAMKLHPDVNKAVRAAATRLGLPSAD